LRLDTEPTTVLDDSELITGAVWALLITGRLRLCLTAMLQASGQAIVVVWSRAGAAGIAVFIGRAVEISEAAALSPTATSSWVDTDVAAVLER